MILFRILLLTTILNYFCVCGNSNQKYLVRANSSLVVTQVKQDGSQTTASVYVTDNYKRTVTLYSDPVARLPATQNPTAKPALGNLGFYERITYCYGSGKSKTPTMLFVNDTKKQIITEEFNSIGINEECEQIVMADIDGDGSNEVVLLTSLANIVKVVVLQDTGLSPTDTQVKILYQVTLSGAYPSYKYSLVAGKFKKEDNATDLIAVTAFTQTSVLLWVLGATKNKLEVVIDQAVVADNLYNLYDYCVPMDAVVAYLNDDAGGGTSTLVIAYQESIVGVTVTIKLKSYQIEGGKLKESASATTSEVSPSAPPANISLSVGKIHSTTAEESVVMTMGPYNGPFHLYILKANNGQLDGHTQWTFTGDDSTFANLHQINSQVLSDTADMIAVIDSYTTDQSLEQALYLLEVKGDKIDGTIIKTWKNSEFSYGYVNSGSMIGLNVFLGPETQYTASRLKNILVHIAAPPYHMKFADIYNGNPSVSWMSSMTNMTQVSMKSSTLWTSSDNFKVSLGLFEPSFSTGVEKSTERMVDTDYQKSVTFQQDLSIETMFDEVILVRDMTYIVTEIPVYIGKKPSGHILVVQPQNKNTNTLFVTTSSNLYYNCSYVLGDVRTYPFGAPNNIDYNIYSVEGTVGYGSSFQYTVSVETMIGKEKALTREQSTQVGSEVDLKFPFNVGDISGSLAGSYSHSSYSSVNTSQTQITNKIQIQLSIPGYSTSSTGKSALQYNVNPYIFWDSAGVFNIAWSVDLPKNDWNSFISAPDPALLIPYGTDLFNGHEAHECVFELYTEPRSIPKDGTSVLISVPIHNYSYRPALDTTVEFYWSSDMQFPPDFDDNSTWKSIGIKHIPSIGGFEQEKVFISWHPQKNLKSAIIIVKIKPSGQDYDTSNNIGYSVWPQDKNNPFVQHFSGISEVYHTFVLSEKFSDGHLISKSDSYYLYGFKCTKELDTITQCPGDNIGNFVYKLNCFNKGGYCCTTAEDGVDGMTFKADSSKEYCGYCFKKGSFDGQPKDEL